MIKVKKYFKITEEQSDELLRSGAPLITDEKMIDDYYQVSEGLLLISREIKENNFRKGARYFKLKTESTLGEEIKIKDEKEIKIRLGIGSGSIEDFISQKELVPFIKHEIERKEFPKGIIMVRIDTENENSTCRLQSEAEKDKIDGAILKIENFAMRYKLEELKVSPQAEYLEKKKNFGENAEITKPQIKMK